MCKVNNTMLLVSREILFDVMRNKKAIALTENESNAGFKNLCKQANLEYDKARTSSKDQNFMTTFSNSMIEFLKQHIDDIKFVGQGSSRMTFAMADGTALKLAKTNAGIA